MNIIQVLKARYSTKKFDPSFTITAEQEQAIKELLRFSPSSVNLQGWKFFIVKSPEGKNKIAKAAHSDYSYNKPKVTDSALTVIFTVKNSIDTDHLDNVINQEEKDGRYPTSEIKEMVYNTRLMFTSLHNNIEKDLQSWLEKQVYLNVGNFLLGLGALGLDACPMEGLDFKVIDQELDLKTQGYHAIMAVSVGKRATDDFNAQAPKSRLTEDKIIEVI